MSGFTWSLADTHCVMCGEGEFVCDCPVTTEVAEVLVALRGLAEAQAAVIARYRDGWVENHTDSEPNGTWWHPPRGEVEPMTDAERQVLYPAGPQPTEGTTA